MKVNSIYLYVIIFSLGILSCNKKEFLEERPNSEVFVPTTLEDFQTLLDNDVALGVTPVLGELSADNFFFNADSWQLLSNKEHNAYIWLPDIYIGQGNVSDWNAPYEQVLYANVVLEGLKKVIITPGNWQLWNNMKGAALFIRAYAFYNLAQVFARPYDATTATMYKGIPLKLSPNVDEAVPRSTLDQTYTQILNDLLQAKDLLPIEITSYRNRPNKPAALAQLARVYLSMRQYDKAGAYADSSLQLYKELIDYNTRDVNVLRPFDRYNAETIYQSKFVETNVLKGGVRDCMVDTMLFNLYAPNDLRRSLFFAALPGGKYYFKGGYNGTAFTFTGLATDEMFLVRAECRVRALDVSGAMSDLNTLLKQRWKTGTFIPFTAPSADSALKMILIERRKEMPCRGVRWTDIRRLNLENASIIPNIIPKRKLNNLEYLLPVNSPLYALPIPPDAVELGHYEQNER
jgi:starch-binding outer membrane protein, SusD/RagB family